MIFLFKALGAEKWVLRCTLLEDETILTVVLDGGVRVKNGLETRPTFDDFRNLSAPNSAMRAPFPFSLVRRLTSRSKGTLRFRECRQKGARGSYS